MSPGVVALLAAATAMLGVFAAYQVASDLYLRDRSRLSERVDEEFLSKRREKARRSPLFKDLGRMAAEVVADGEGRPSMARRFAAMVEQSGLEVTPGRVLAIAGGLAAGLALVAFVPRRSPIDAGLAAVAGGLGPVLYVRRRRDGRVEALRAQLPEAFDLMGRVVRAGQTLGQAMLAVADEFPRPISEEFGQCYEQQNLGLSPEVAFRDLARRSGVLDLQIFALAVIVQQQTGGNLADLLGKLARVVRERYAIRGTIRTLTAEGRMQGWILAAMPPLMLALLMVINPKYALRLFEHPDVLVGTFGLEVVGAFWIRKVVNFDF